MSVSKYFCDGQWKGTIIVSLLFGSIPFGLIMALVTDDTNWLYFCLPIFIFLS